MFVSFFLAAMDPKTVHSLCVIGSVPTHQLRKQCAKYHNFINVYKVLEKEANTYVRNRGHLFRGIALMGLRSDGLHVGGVNPPREFYDFAKLRFLVDDKADEDAIVEAVLECPGFPIMYKKPIFYKARYATFAADHFAMAAYDG